MKREQGWHLQWIEFSFLPSGKIRIGSLLLSATCSLSLWKQKESLKYSSFPLFFPQAGALKIPLCITYVWNKSILLDTNLYLLFFFTETEALCQPLGPWSITLEQHPVFFLLNYFTTDCQRGQQLYAIKPAQLTLTNSTSEILPI